MPSCSTMRALEYWTYVHWILSIPPTETSSDGVTSKEVTTGGISVSAGLGVGVEVTVEGDVFVGRVTAVGGGWAWGS